MQVPQGYQFLDAEGTRIFLRDIHRPEPKGLAGLMTAASQDWYIVFSWSETGYVSDSNRASFNQDSLLKAIWMQTDKENKSLSKQGLPTVTHVSWEMKPEYHAARNLLDFAIRMDGHSENDAKINYVAKFLGRRGVLEANFVRRLRAGDDLADVKRLLRALSFKEGEAYAEYKNGDKAAAGGLPELVTLYAGAAELTKAVAAADPTGGFKVIWIALGVIGCVGVTGGMMLARKLRRQKSASASSAAEEEQVSQAVAHPAPQLAARPHGNGTNGSKSFRLDIKPGSPAFKAASHTNGNGNGNGHSNGNGNGQNGKRRRMFNYHKFYTEMVLQGPAPVIEPINVYAGHETDSRLSSAATLQAGGVEAHSELLNHQKALIEEQKRLIHEQAKLIEEKSKLIAEKNQLLDRQSQMIDNNLL